jgi:integrase
VASGDARTRQAYALLRSIMATAETDGLIGKNPCQVKGAGVAKSPERPLLSLAEFSALVEAHPEHMRAALHLAMGAHLRLGELVALQRRDLDLAAGTLRVERQIVADGAEPTPTKTGKADTIDLPSITVEIMRDYLASVPKALPATALFVRADGRAFTRSMVTQAWAKARRTVQVEHAHFHDLRHAGLTLSAQSGATLAELRKRARHLTNAAALVYQHAAEERGKIVAAGLDTALRAAE